MSSRRNYDIAFVGLKPGIHEFEYEIDDKFFLDYQEQDFRNCVAHIKLTLDKNNGFMRLKFEVGGKAEVTCDRCGNSVWRQFDTPTAPDEATIDQLESQARSIQYGDPSPETTPDELADLDNG